MLRCLDSFRTGLERIQTVCVYVTNALEMRKATFPGTDPVDVSEIESRNVSLIETNFRGDNDIIPFINSYFEPIKWLTFKILKDER